MDMDDFNSMLIFFKTDSKYQTYKQKSLFFKKRGQNRFSLPFIIALIQLPQFFMQSSVRSVSKTKACWRKRRKKNLRKKPFTKLIKYHSNCWCLQAESLIQRCHKWLQFFCENQLGAKWLRASSYHATTVRRVFLSYCQIEKRKKKSSLVDDVQGVIIFGQSSQLSGRVQWVEIFWNGAFPFYPVCTWTCKKHSLFPYCFKNDNISCHWIKKQNVKNDVSCPQLGSSVQC